MRIIPKNYFCLVKINLSDSFMTPLIIILAIAEAASLGLIARLIVLRSRDKKLRETEEKYSPDDPMEEFVRCLNAISLSVKRLKQKAPMHGEEYKLIESNLKKIKRVVGLMCGSSGDYDGIKYKETKGVGAEIIKAASTADEGFEIEPDTEFVEKMTKCFEDHIADQGYGRAEMARDLGVSQSVLYKKLRATTGLSTSEFMRNIRIGKACQLLKTIKNVRISDVAYSVGYSDPKYFATIFKRVLGMQPTEYLEKLTKENGQS